MPVLFFVIQSHFGKGESTVFDLKHGVVTEPLRPPSPEGDRSFAVPLHRCQHTAVRSCNTQRRTKTRLAVVAIPQLI